ncbi:MAG: DEAD/DEAH box helicase family protein [Planctomycetes bacterium]|nr:DEAD/DEAH box helicase family protein [Planctomycetota bacterium]
MEPKEYQQKALGQVKRYLDNLYAARNQYEQMVAQGQGSFVRDYPSVAWEQCDIRRAYNGKRDGLGRPLPSFCLKVPTGGGKTFLAVKAIDLINTSFLKRQTGLVLWIVPTTQIYRQTIKGLRNRDHPYRQHLDIASGGRTVILEKTDRFTPLDVEENLAVLMLMLPSASRRNKEVLRMFRDSGGFADFFPDEDNVEGNSDLLDKVGNLDTFEAESAFWGKQIKTSLGNTLRLLSPIVILDEGHKAYSETAQGTLRGFNPCIIVELSATPAKGSNILVDITGIELNREEMIKFDLHIFNKASPDWKDTLLDSHNHLEMLKEKTREYEGQTGDYIRPICLIQVERTGKGQRGSGFIHAEDVREHLIDVMGIPPEQIAVKTSEKDELKEVDDVGGLMSRNCQVRYIITKQALQEGWDCAFAYVLSILTKPGSKTALTQLVGRILRQPFAKKTGMKELDESYVFCFQQQGAKLLEEIRQGFRGEGLGDLMGRISVEDEVEGLEEEERLCQLRHKFTKAAGQVILPVFVMRDGSGWRKVNYEMDIASRIPWGQTDLDKMSSLALSLIEEKDFEQVAGISEDISQVIELKEAITLRKGSLKLDSVFMARHLMDIVPNPWVAHEFGKHVMDGLLGQYEKKVVVNNFVFIIEELRKHLFKEKDKLAKHIFREMISKDEMRFLVVANDLGYKLPKKKRVKSARKLTKKSGEQLERSLFDYVPEEDFNEMEKKVAWYLEEQERLFFWYRNIPKEDYSVQGWRKYRIYADFIFTVMDNGENEFDRVFVVETKGLHLKGSEDTEYKRSVFDLCNDLAKKTTTNQLGMELESQKVLYHVVDEDEWQQRFNEILYI